MSYDVKYIGYVVIHIVHVALRTMSSMRPDRPQRTVPEVVWRMHSAPLLDIALRFGGC